MRSYWFQERPVAPVFLRPCFTQAGTKFFPARDPMAHPTPQEVFVTGNRWGDLMLFVVLAALILASSVRLRVYYRVPAARSDAHGPQ